MTIEIDYTNKSNSKPTSNLVLFTNEKFSTDKLKKHLSDSEISYINDLLKTSDLKKSILVFKINSR